MTRTTNLTVKELKTLRWMLHEAHDMCHHTDLSANETDVLVDAAEFVDVIIPIFED